MRRKDRQVTDPQKIETIFQNAECCRLGFVDDGAAYIVPLSFGFVKENNAYTLYFHGAPKGKKIDLITKTGEASFEIEANCRLKQGTQACTFSYYYQSVIGRGKIRILTDEQETLRALKCVTRHYTHEADMDINPKMLAVTVGIRLDIEEMTAKEYQPQP